MCFDIIKLVHPKQTYIMFTSNQHKKVDEGARIYSITNWRITPGSIPSLIGAVCTTNEHSSCSVGGGSVKSCTT